MSALAYDVLRPVSANPTYCSQVWQGESLRINAHLRGRLWKVIPYADRVEAIQFKESHGWQTR